MDNQNPGQPNPANTDTQQPPQPTTVPDLTPKPKNKLRWLFIAIPIVLFLGLIFIFILGPAAARIQAKATASDYMQAIKDDDNDAMIELSGEGRSDFTKSATSGLKGASYKITETIKKDPGFVVNFEVTGSATIHDASVVVHTGKVTSFLLNTKGSSASSQDQAATPSTSASACLTVPDLKGVGITYIDEQALQPGARVFFADLFFAPDSSTFLSDSAAESEITKASNLYSKTTSKNYTFEIQGAVHEATSTDSGVALANERANKIKSELEKRGVPASKITVIEAKSGVNQTDSTGSADRSITVFLKMPDSCGAAESDL